MQAIPIYSRRKVAELSSASTTLTPIDFYYMELSPSSREIIWVEKCSMCGKIWEFKTSGANVEFSCCTKEIIIEPSSWLEHVYPLPNESITHKSQISILAPVIAHLPFAFLCVHEGPDHNYFLIPRQKFLPLNRQICEVYMRMGYLPPLSAAEIADEYMENQGRGLDVRDRWVISAANETLRRTEIGAKKQRGILKKLKNGLGRVTV